MFKILFILIISILIPNQFRNMPIDLVQPDTEIISCFISGDEFYQRLHDEKNYTIIQSEKDGYYYYATKNGDTIIPTLFKALTINPDEKNWIFLDLELTMEHMSPEKSSLLWDSIVELQKQKEYTTVPTLKLR